MQMTLSLGTIQQNFYPNAAVLAHGESIVVHNIPASTRPGGVVSVEIKRLTEEYFKVREIV